MLVTDQGQTIRVPVDGIRVAGRNTQGVTLFRTSEGERVVSVERIEEGAEGRSRRMALPKASEIAGRPRTRANRF